MIPKTRGIQRPKTGRKPKMCKNKNRVENREGEKIVNSQALYYNLMETKFERGGT